MARSELTLGFVGSGKIEKKNAFALLTDLIDASGGNAKFILPMTKGFWNEYLVIVSDFAIDNNIPVEAVVDDTTAKMREVKHLLASVRKQHQSAAAAHKLAALLEEARDGRLVVLWDDEDEEALDAVRAADGKGVALLELTRGLDRIELVADDEDEEEPVTDEVEEPEEEAEEAEPEDDEEEEEAEEEEAGEDDEEESDEEELEAEDEFEEAEAEEDLDEVAEDDEEVEFPDEEEEFVAPEEDEDVLVNDGAPGMSEFQERMVAAFERFSEAISDAVRIATIDGAKSVAVKAEALAKKVAAGTESKAAAKKATAPTTKRVVPPPAKKAPAKAAGTVKKTAPARRAPEPEPEPEKPVRRAVPAKKATAAPTKKAAPARRAPAEESNGNGSMSKAEAQKVMDAYRPKRGRPPAEVTEARKVLGLM